MATDRDSTAVWVLRCRPFARISLQQPCFAHGISRCLCLLAHWLGGGPCSCFSGENASSVAICSLEYTDLADVGHVYLPIATNHVPHRALVLTC